MKFRSVDCRRVPSDTDLWTVDVPEGSFWWYRQGHNNETWRALWVKMPYDVAQNAHRWHNLRVREAGKPRPPEPFWEWDGDENKPTLTPSIGCGPKDDHNWHGYLTAGRLEACE